MKHTAVEWLENEILNSDLKMKLQTGLKLFALIKQAKEMEKQQIKNAYSFGIQDEYVIGSEQYYYETFKNTKQ